MAKHRIIDCREYDISPFISNRTDNLINEQPILFLIGDDIVHKACSECNSLDLRASIQCIYPDLLTFRVLVYDKIVYRGIEVDVNLYARLERTRSSQQSYVEYVDGLERFVKFGYQCRIHDNNNYQRNPYLNYLSGEPSNLPPIIEIDIDAQV